MSGKPIPDETLPQEEVLFTPDELALVDPAHIPKHIAIIPDGNRRWAKNKNSGPEMGHQVGADNLIEIVKAAKALGVETVTLYTFSTENWVRPKRDIAGVMWLLESYLINERKAMVENGVRLHTIGDLSRLPPHICETLEKVQSETASCDQIDLVLAVNYGGRDDIKRGVVKLLDAFEKGTVKKEEITEALISKYLDTAPWEDPDLLIRTSGEKRVSNFLLWQISYTEIYISEVFWPAFGPRHLLEAVIDFQKRERRLGGV